VDEDVGAIGKICKVIEPINEENTNGRIRYQGTSWKATCTEGTIPAGSMVKLLYRDNLVWIVDRSDDLNDLMENDEIDYRETPE